MKAVGAFPKEKKVRLVDVPEPEIDGPGQVKVRMLEVGICGTDKEIARFEYGDPPPGSDYLILGHESLGEIVEVSAGEGSLRPGDLVVMMVRRPCSEPDCLSCRSGRQDFCYTGKFTERGIKQRDGFMAEYIVDEVRYAVPVPKDLRDIGVLTEPLTIAEKSYLQILGIQERLPWLCLASGNESPLNGRSALVLGAGPVGLLGAMKLVSAGARTAVYSRDPAGSEKAKTVEGLGVQYVSGDDVPVRDLREKLGQIDVVYEATGAAPLAFEILGQLSPNAIFVFTGVPGRRDPIDLDAGTLMKKIVLENQVVLGTVNAGRDAFEAGIRDLRVFRQRFGNRVAALITGRVPIGDFDRLDLQGLKGTKTVLEIAS